MDPSLVDDASPKPSQDEEILELAKKELLREIKCASIRAEQFGAHSWAKPQKYVPSKRFLRHMIVNDSRFNDRREQRSAERSKSRHSSSFIRHFEYLSEKSSQSNSFHSRHRKKREISSQDERVGNKKEKLYPENVKHYSSKKTLRKSTKLETHKEKEIISSNEKDRSFKNRRENSPPRGKKHRTNSLLVLDKESVESSSEEDKQIKNFPSMSCEIEKDSKRKKYRKTFPYRIEDKPSSLHFEHDKNTKEMPSELNEISSLSRHRKRKKHSKKETSKYH